MTFTNNYDAFVPEIWGGKLNAGLEKNCVMLQCVNRNWEGDIATQGDTVKIITPGDVTISSLDSSVSYSEIAPTSASLVIDQKKVFAFKINDVALAQANTDIMEGYLNKAKHAIEVEQDVYLLGKHVDVASGNTLGGTTAISLTASNIYSQFVQLAQILKNSSAITDGKKPWVVINPDIEALLLQSSQFTSSYQIADETLRNGSIGRIAGMDVLVTPNLTATDSKINVLAGTNDAITYASQLAKIEVLRDPDSFSDLVRGLYLYGAKTVNAGALAKMVCSISTSS
ncbi:MAG: hypothetical protein MRZ90_07225 [Candidatus Gastranaerophilales bacterium]|nr:hypothetical protein [Candidatus Gastranaerophilales bacterium]